MNTEMLAAMLRPKSITPEVLEALYALGHRLLTEDDAPRSAAPIFRVMLACAPTDERAWMGLGECHARMDEEDIALEIFGAGTVAVESAPSLHLARARLLRAQGRLAEAREAWGEAAAIARETRDDALGALVRRERERAA